MALPLQDEQRIGSIVDWNENPLYSITGVYRVKDSVGYEPTEFPGNSLSADPIAWTRRDNSRELGPSSSVNFCQKGENISIQMDISLPPPELFLPRFPLGKDHPGDPFGIQFASSWDSRRTQGISGIGRGSAT